MNVNQDEFNLYMLGKLGEVERDLHRLGTTLTRTVVTAKECQDKVSQLRRELNDRILDACHERPKEMLKAVAFKKEQ